MNIIKSTVTTLDKSIHPLGRRVRQIPESTFYLGRRFLAKKVNKKIFFLHHPKCGGTSIDHALRNSFGVSEYLLGKKSFHLNPRDCNKDKNFKDYRERLLIEQLSNPHMQYISGHFPFSNQAFQEFAQEWNFVTVLRNPVDRWFSLYFFNRYKHSDHAKLNTNLEQYIESGEGIFHGLSYVRAFTDWKKVPNLLSLDQTSLNEAVDQAIKNLNNFTLVGILEKMDVFNKDFQNLFGTELFIPRFNPNPLSKSQQKEKYTDQIYEQVIKICQPNIKIYESVLKRIDSVTN